MHQVRRVKVDLSMAQLFLGLELQPELGVEDTNRKFSQDVVDDYTADMLCGRWRETHQGMAFTGFLKDDTAVFVDGGQRCRAIVRAATEGMTIGGVEYPPDPDIAFYFMVSEGLTQADVEAMDIGKRRTPGDAVQMKGWGHKIITASVARLCILYENVPWSKDGWRKYPVTPTMINQYLRENPGVREAVTQGLHVTRQINPSSAATAWHQATRAGIEEKVVTEFFEHLYAGTNMDKGNPILVLRELMSNSKKVRRRYSREEQLALLIKAFNRWLAGDKIQLLMFRMAGPDAEDFPRLTN